MMNHETMIALATAGVLIVLDFVSGLTRAAMEQDVNSAKLREGLYHKGAFVLALVLAEIIETAQHWVDLGFTVPLVIPAAVYVCLTEVVSILENLAEINPELAGSSLLRLFSVGTDTTPQHATTDTTTDGQAVTS